MHVKSHEQIQFKIEGMDCAEEVGILKREVGPLVGGDDRLAFDVLNGVMSVTGLVPEDQAKVIEASAGPGCALDPSIQRLARRSARGGSVKGDRRSRPQAASSLLRRSPFTL